MHANAENRRASRIPAWSWFLLFSLIALVYIALIGRYNAYDIDSRWFPSFSYAFVIDHIQTDPFMHGQFPDGMGGVIAFGKLAALIQGNILHLAGWSIAAATGISIAFVLASLVLLADTCRRLGCSANFTFCYICCMGLTEPFVAAAERTRYEFLPTFLLCLALCLAARNKFVLAMFLAALATEVEPAGVVLAIGVATFLVVQNAKRSEPIPKLRLAFHMIHGWIAAVGMYLLLHPHILSTFQQAHWDAINQVDYRVPGGFVTAYFLVFARHRPELVILLAAIGLCLFKKSKRHLLTDWPALCAAVILICATILRWPDNAYFVFIAPFLGFFVLQACYTDRRRNWILLAILLFTLPQYIHRYQLWNLQTPGFSQQDEAYASAAIDRTASMLGKPPAQLNILGDYSLWPAHPHLFVNLNKKTFNADTLRQADLILCLDHPFDPNPLTTQEVLCGDLPHGAYTQTDQVTLNHRQVRLLIPTASQ